MPEVYYSVEPYTGDIIQHAGVPGMKWGWTKDGKRTGAKEAMTEQERAQRRKELLAKIGKGLGIAAGVAGAALAIKNRKAIGSAINKVRDKITKKRTGLDNIKSNFSTLKGNLFKKPSKFDIFKKSISSKIKNYRSNKNRQRMVNNIKSNFSTLRKALIKK